MKDSIEEDLTIIMLKNITYIILVCLAFVLSGVTLGAEYRGKLKVNGDELISGLRWDADRDTQEPRIEKKVLSNNQTKYVVSLKGYFPSQKGNLVYQTQEVTVGSDSTFVLNVEVDSPSTEFQLMSISSEGVLQRQKTLIEFPQWAELLQNPNSTPAEKRLKFYPGVGTTLYSYQQTDVASFSGTALTFKGSAVYSIKKLFDIEASAFYMALPISQTVSGMNMQILGVNLRAGFRFPKEGAPWSLTILGGFYYTTTYTGSSVYGYADVSGPQLYPVLTRTFPKADAAWIYLKYSPMFSGFSVLNLNNAELAGGVGYRFRPIKEKHVLAISFDAALLRLQLSGVSVQSNSFTLGVNYQL